MNRVQKTQDHPRPFEFPYRRKLYRLEGEKELPCRHVVLSNGTILVVSDWAGCVPRLLADIRRSPVGESAASIARQLDGIIAREVPLLPGQTTRPMGVLDFQGQRYAVNTVSRAIIEMPDGRLYRIAGATLEQPVHVESIVPFDPHDEEMASQFKRNGKTPALPVAADYPGMAYEPRDMRIRFSMDDERYILSEETYEQGKPYLYVPDRGYFRIGSYLESMPVQLGSLTPLPACHYPPDQVGVALRLADAVDGEPYREEHAT